MLEPEKLTYADAKGYLPALPFGGVKNFESEILKLIEEKDFWQNAARYVGPMPAPGPGFAAAMLMLKRSFVPILKAREVLRRHVRGVVGNAPHFEIVFPELVDGSKKRRKRPDYESSRTAVEALADEVDALQGEVWDENMESKKIDAFAKRLRATGKAYLRYDVPPGLIKTKLNDDGSEAVGEDNKPIRGVEVDDWKDAYELLYVELAPWGSATVYTDPFTNKKTSFYSYKEPRPGDPKATRNCVQVSWLERVREGDERYYITRVRVLRDDNQNDEWSLDTGGNLLVIDAEMEPLLTPDILQLQDIECAMATMVKINDDVAGFPQETMTDIAVPAKYEDDPDNPGERKRVEVPLPTGPRTIRYLYSYQDKDENGRALTDEQGKPVIRQGALHHRAPVSSDPLRADADWIELQIYRATNQAHVPARASAAASAAMLVELRSDYADSLMETKPDVEGAVRKLFHARLCLSAYLAQNTELLKQLKRARMRVDCQLNAGPLSVEERTEILTRYEKKLLSKQTAMVLLGTEDVDAELAQLKEEQMEEFGDGFMPKAVVPGVLGDPGDAAAPSPAEEVGPTDETGGIDAEKTLNGAQITAAVDVVAKLQLGSIGRETAIILLMKVGISREEAAAIVNDSEGKKPIEPRGKPVL